MDIRLLLRSTMEKTSPIMFVHAMVSRLGHEFKGNALHLDNLKCLSINPKNYKGF